MGRTAVYNKCLNSFHVKKKYYVKGDTNILRLQSAHVVFLCYILCMERTRTIFSDFSVRRINTMSSNKTFDARFTTLTLHW